MNISAIVTPEIMLSVIGGIVVTVLAGLLKPLFARYNPQVIVLSVALLLGVGYTAFITFVPEVAKQAIVNFAITSLSFGVLIYEFIWKNLKKD
jgi:hypothetical protein